MLLFFVILFLYVGSLRAALKFVCFDVFTQHAASLLYYIMFLILSNASANFSSLAQREMRMYRLPLLPKMNPGVMNTRAS